MRRTTKARRLALCAAFGSLVAACGGDSNTAETDPDAGTGPSEPLVETDAGGLSVTLRTEPFDLAPSEEAFYCQGFSNPFGRDVVVTDSESIMTTGSHHLLVFHGTEFDTSPLTACDGLQFGPFVHSAQRSHQAFAYPEGIGRFLPGSDNLRIQVHYFNTTTETLHANVEVHLNAIERSEATELASYLFINTLNIDVPPLSTGSATKSCDIPHDIYLMTAASHMHRHAVQFRATSNDGTVIYENDQWAEPDVRIFEPDLFLPAGSRIDIRCDYANDTDAPLTFGESAATNEMCILNSVFYPAPEGAPISCVF